MTPRKVIPQRNETQQRPPRWMLVGGLCAFGLALAVLAALEWGGMPRASAIPVDQITDFMPRKQVERILGTGTVVQSKVENVGTGSAKIEILEWRTPDGHQRIRIEFVDDQVLSKSVSDL